jgi:hypothetical protein
MQMFSIHAAERCGVGDRQWVEHLCHDVTRPALTDQRTKINPVGKLVLKLKTPWHNGTADQVVSRLKFTPRRIELPLSGRQLRCSYVSNGSQCKAMHCDPLQSFARLVRRPKGRRSLPR